jgi:hypothetical protein
LLKCFAVLKYLRNLGISFFQAKFAVCSLHFRDGYPTPENPHPTELLTETETDPVFRGRRPDAASSAGGAVAAAAAAHQLNVELCESLLETVIMGEVNRQIVALETERAEEERKNRERDERRRRDILALRGIKFYHFISHQVTRAAKTRRIKKRWGQKQLAAWRKPTAISVRSKFTLVKAKDRLVYRQSAVEKSFVALPRRASHAIWRGHKCRFCPLHFSYSKTFFQHVRSRHIAPIRRRNQAKLDVRPNERRRILGKLYPPISGRSLDPKKKYVCAVCKSVCDLYGLFIHMKEVHHGLLCMYCLKLFKKVSTRRASTVFKCTVVCEGLIYV